MIFDVVMPLPRHKVDLPKNELEQVYHDLLAADGLTLEDFEQVNKSFSLCGDYRRVIGRAEELSWRTVRYSDPSKSLVESDLDRLRGVKEAEGAGNEPEGKYKAVIVDFKLKSSHYATMAIREALHLNTSKKEQAELTQAQLEQIQGEKRKADNDQGQSEVEAKKAKIDKEEKVEEGEQKEASEQA